MSDSSPFCIFNPPPKQMKSAAFKTAIQRSSKHQVIFWSAASCVFLSWSLLWGS